MVVSQNYRSQASLLYLTPLASGIGLATGRLFASKGWTIAVADLNTTAGEKVAEELKGMFYKTNVSDYDNLAQTFSKVWQKYGRLDFGAWFSSCGDLFYVLVY